MERPLKARRQVSSLLLFSALALAGCASAAPLPVITLTPEGPFEWARGRAMLHQRSERGVSFWVAFERDRGAYLEWWIRIENHTQRTLRVSPDYFFYRVAETETGGPNVKAMDPTRALAELDYAQASDDAREAEAAQRQGPHDFLDRVIDGMLGFEHPSPSEARHANDQRRATYLAEQDHRERWRDTLANQTVRRGVLGPGETVQGMVLFPRLEHAGRTELILIVPPAIARFPYGGRR